MYHHSHLNALLVENDDSVDCAEGTENGIQHVHSDRVEGILDNKQGKKKKKERKKGRKVLFIP